MNDRDCDNCAHHSDGGCSVWECSFAPKEDDTISRQAAVDAICGECQANCIPCECFPCGEIKAVQALPSAQPDLQPTCNNLATDAISRQAAIDCLCNGKCTEEGRWCDDGDCMPVRRINSLPSVQPGPCLDLIVSEIEETIRETKESGKHHDINVRANGDLICYGLQLALEIIEEKRNERFDIQAIGD